MTLKVTRDEARQLARAFLQEQGAGLDPYREAAVFGGDTGALVFLQRTLGVEEASRWTREEVPVWGWNLRWFRPTEKEEWRARVDVDGRIVGFAHLVEEAAAGANLDVEAALGIAEAFLRHRGWDLEEWDRVEASSEKRDNRTDHDFTWERRGRSVPWKPEDPEAGTGAVRLSVTVQGDEVGAYRLFLKVPEEFSRELSRAQSVGLVLTYVSLFLSLVLALVAVGVAIARYRRDDVRWRPAFVLASGVGLLFLIQGLTTWPAIKFGYPTEFQWAAFLGLLLVGLLVAVAIYGTFVLFVAAAGESLGRETYPDSLAGLTEATQGRLLTPALAAAGLRGYALGFLFLGYLTVFYVLARETLGAWLPAEGPYSEIFNYYLPFLTPLTISLVAAVSEELAYRLFGITLLKRYLRSTLLALLLPAAIWALGHSSYPVFPPYVRAIELTLGGLVFGYAFLRLGLLTCIVAHYVVDAVIIGMPLLTAGNPAYLVWGLAIMALALLPALLALLARRRAPAALDPPPAQAR